MLVIDCENSLADAARRAFTGVSFVTCATQEDDGMRQAQADQPDIILLGYLEPRGTSHRLAARLATEPATAQIPLLVVDVRPEEFASKGWRWSDGFSHNIKGYLWRPVGAAELRRTAEGVLQRGGAMNLAEVATQTEEMLKRIDSLKRLLMSGPDAQNKQQEGR